MVFTTEGFLKVAAESWPEWDLNLRPVPFSIPYSVFRSDAIRP